MLKRLLIFLGLLVGSAYAASTPTYINAGTMRCGWVERPNSQIQTWCWEGLSFNNTTLRCNHLTKLSPAGAVIDTCNDPTTNNIVTWKFALVNNVLTYEVATNGSLSMSIITQNIPDAIVGRSYTAAIIATGGTPPYTWSILAGQLPPGLTLSQVGVLSGTPTHIGSWLFTLLVTDSTGVAAVYPPAQHRLTAVVLGQT